MHCHRNMTPERRRHPPVAVEAMLEANALDRITQFAIPRLVIVCSQVPVKRSPWQAPETAQVLDVSARTDSSWMRAFASTSAERFLSSVCSGLSRWGPGLGPRLRFSPSGSLDLPCLDPVMQELARYPELARCRQIAFAALSTLDRL